VLSSGDPNVLAALGTVVPMPPPRPPKPPIIPERTDDGWRTAGLHLRRAPGNGFYIEIDHPTDGHHRVHLTGLQSESLLALIEAPAGALWKRLSEIPLERLLPSRQLDEELRVMLRTFAAEVRQARRG
jgi:hypothetical protein